MISRGSAVLAHVNSIGEQQRLQMLPVLRKPFETNAILKLLQDLKLGHPPAVAGRIDLDEALAKDWIEFWYQPKIDLRKKQLVGAEAFARARHPTLGILMPGAFMPGANEASLIALSEIALANALTAAVNFAKLGVNLRMAVNIPVNALVKLAVPDIVADLSPAIREMAGTDHRRDRGADRYRSGACLRHHQDAWSTSTSSSRSTNSAAVILRWRGLRNCRLPNSSSTAPS